MTNNKLENEIKAAEPGRYKDYDGQLATKQAVLYVSRKTGLAPYTTHFITRCKVHGIDPVSEPGTKPNYYSVADLDALCHVLRTKADGRTIAVEVIE